jgi:glucose/arabinose dehydrogenase
LLLAALTLGAIVTPGLAPAARASGPTPFFRQINFQPQTVATPNGYLPDYGAPYASTSTFGDYGWVVPNTNNGTSMVGNAKQRKRVSDQRLDTLMVVKTTAPAMPPQWVMYVPNGTYDVTISVGDYLGLGNNRTVINGVVAISKFKSSSTHLFDRVSVSVSVTDNYLRVDAAPPPGADADSRWDYVDLLQEVAPGPHQFTSITPTPNATDVPVNTSVTLTTVNSVVDQNTLTSDAIKLTVLDAAPACSCLSGDVVPGFLNTDAAGGVINFTPSKLLAPYVTYQFETNLSLLGTDGVPFAEQTIVFETGPGGPQPPASFQHVAFDSLQGPTVLQLGPDKKLYVGTAIGEIRRYTIDQTTGLPSGAPLVIDTYLNTSTITGLAFSGTGSSLRVWVSRGVLCDQCDVSQTGTISVLSGSKLATARDVIVGLPRSYHDHMNNGIHFGPDGKLYIAQGAMTGYGAPDQYWGFRSETPESASLLVADVLNDARFAGPSPVDVDTNHGYDPFAAGAPLQVYAEGLRNVFDFLFASNGHLYVPVNESAGGNTPACPGGNPPALTNLPPGRDLLDDVTAGQHYYGHPNPAQGHCVLNGGNPTAGVDAWEVPQYPVGTQPDPAWVAPIYDLGDHRSPDGITQYTANLFQGRLKGQLLITEFSVGKDVEAIKLDPTGTQVVNEVQVAGGFDNPIGIATDASGRIYVAEFGAQPLGDGGKITLLTPLPGVTTPYEHADFGPQTSPPSPGYFRDYGAPFTPTSGNCTQADGSGCGYGWIDENDTNPLTMNGAVARTPAQCPTVSDERLLSWIPMQPSSAPPGRWMIELPAGKYVVTASVGDCASTSSIDELSANGTELVHLFTPTNRNRFASGSATITISASNPDGTGPLTLDAAGGTNTKLDYVDIDLLTAVPPDQTAPSVTLTPSGTVNVNGCYVGSVTVTANATDPDNPSSVLTLTDSVDGQTISLYPGPVQISGDGTHTIAVGATDPSGNFGFATASYCIDSDVPSVLFHTPDELLGNGPRLVFSTSNGDPTRPSKPVFITNPSPTKTLQVNSLLFHGTDASSFNMMNPPSLPFNVAPGGQQEVDVRFQPDHTGIEQLATLDVGTNDPVQTTFSLPLAGLDAVGFEGGKEPPLKQIISAFGYSDQLFGNPGKTRLPDGDEQISPYWLAANPSQPVVLHPIAHYSTRVTTCSIPTGWDTQAAPKTVNNLFCFPGGTDPYGGQNQMIFPGFTGTDTFSPGTTPFGIDAGGSYSDDFYNGSCKFHDVRFFPAKDSSNTAIPHTWLVAVDLNNTCPASGKNFDYQDEVSLLSNADPLVPTAPVPGSSKLSADFCNVYPGTVNDKFGNGTGFTTVMPNTAGNQYDPTKISGAGTCSLQLTSTNGTMTAQANNQINALADNFDATRGAFTISSRLLGPFTQINSGHDHQALFFGADQNDFMKIEIEPDPSHPGQQYLVAFLEQVTAAGGISNKIIATANPPSLGSASTVDFAIHCDPSTASCTFTYSVDGGTVTDMGVTATAIFPLLVFNTNAYAGVLVSNQSSTTSFVGAYKSFSVTTP